MIDIRVIQPKDTPLIHELLLKAYDTTKQADLVEQLRKANFYDKELALVAIMDNQIVGHILFTRVVIKHEKQTYPGLALSSCTVDPAFQNQGIGTQLIQEGLKKCKYLGYKIVFVTGLNNYFKKFGFESLNEEDITLASGYSIPLPLVYRLSPEGLTIKGELYYPLEFCRSL